MSATIIDGRAVAERVHQQVAERTARLAREFGMVPGLAVVLVGEDPASQVYVASKARLAKTIGIHAQDYRLPAQTTTTELLDLLARLNEQADVHGILVQLPLPKQVDEAAVLSAIDPAKDVDGFHAVNVGNLWLGRGGPVPCTPMGIMVLIHTVTKDLAGKRALVIGRSNIVGKPIAQLLLRESCTVTVAHSQTRDLPALCGEAEILVAALGKPNAIAGDWIRPGAIVMDVGINRIPGTDGKNKLVGDVDFAGAVTRAGAITPVPGGVGPMTPACLMVNTVNAAIRAHLGPEAQLIPL